MTTQNDKIITNSFWNLLGLLLPLSAAVLAMPQLVRGLGVDRLGVLVIVWGIIGTFGFLDIGIGRALTRVIAERLATGNHRDLPVIFTTAIFMLLVLGSLGTAVLVGLGSFLVDQVLKIPPPLRHETLRCCYVLAIAIPIVTSGEGMRGVLEGRQRYDVVNVIRIPMSILTFLGPVLLLNVTKNLTVIVTFLACMRLAVWIAYLLASLKFVPEIRGSLRVNVPMIKPLASFGSWMTVANIIGPLTLYSDRLLIGSIVSLKALTYYATPFETVSRLWMIPSSIVRVLFSSFAAEYARAQVRAAVLFGRSVVLISMIIYPITLVFIAFAQDGLTLWLGPAFGQNSTEVLQWLASGVFVHSIAQVPYSLVQAAGRPDLTAKLHFVEAPAAFALSFCMIRVWGIEGAAIAWFLRICGVTIVLFAMAQYTLKFSMSTFSRIAVTIGSGLATLQLARVSMHVTVKVLVVVLLSFSYGALVWRVSVSASDRLALEQFYNRLFRREVADCVGLNDRG